MERGFDFKPLKEAKWVKSLQEQLYRRPQTSHQTKEKKNDYR